MSSQSPEGEYHISAERRRNMRQKIISGVLGFAAVSSSLTLAKTDSIGSMGPVFSVLATPAYYTENMKLAFSKLRGTFRRTSQSDDSIDAWYLQEMFDYESDDDDPDDDNGGYDDPDDDPPPEDPSPTNSGMKWFDELERYVHEHDSELV